MVQELAGDIVVAGLACRLPESNNAEEFWSHLVNKEDMVTEDGRRWKPGLHGLPKRSGKLKDIKHFDATFFGVHAKQAHKMDPQLRILLELTYESLVDAGVDPQTIRNSTTGVFVGATGSEAGEAFSANADEMVGYGMTGCCRAMFANRISFTFDFKGPSFAIDTACSSSLLAMDCAVQAIRSGSCDAAVVGGVSVTLKPNTSVDFLRLNMLSPDGACKAFDASGDGYCRSEGAVVIYLTKKSVAKRIYAHVVNSKTNSDGYKTQGVTYPNGELQRQLLEKVYTEANINPGDVSYVEAHGTGTKTGDPEELNAITRVICDRRRPDAGPLLIGSVKSNIGHPEPASGLAGITKVALAMQHGVLPPNLHFNSPNPDIEALVDGRLKVVTEPTEWSGGLVGVNSFGFGGSNVHVVLKSPEKPTTPSNGENPLPVVVPCSGRTEEGVTKMLNFVKDNRSNELISLVTEISKRPLNTFPFRGYTVLGMDAEEVIKVKPSPRPVWFVFSGMGTQWNGMGKELMKIPTFKKSIQKANGILKDVNIDVEKLLLQSDEDTYKNTINSFVGLASIQVALVDCLKVLGVEPEGIIGHSVGELGCAYADGSFTAEEVIKAAYWRGRCVTEAKLPPGAMAAVGLTWAEAKRRCPDGVRPACHNAQDTVTISGEAKAVNRFVQELKAEDVFAKEVNTSGVAFHSQYMAPIAPVLLASLEKFVVPKKRSSRWVSTSIPEDKWHTELAAYSSAEYQVNNLVSPVLFQEALKKVPGDAILLEIAPHGLLQAILKRSVGAEAVNIPLMKRNHPDNLEFFLSNLGKIYANGVNIDPTKLTWEKAPFPVSVNTPSIAPHVGWDHSQEWDVPGADNFVFSSGDGSGSSCQFTFDMSGSSPDKYLEGHCIDGRVLFPATGYLVLAWKALAKSMGLLPEHMPVAFEDVAIRRATILPKSGPVTLKVHLMPASNRFDVSEEESLCVSGKIFVPEANVLTGQFKEVSPTGDDVQLTADCIYKELRLRGYDYGPTFQGIIAANGSGTKGELLWNGNWVSFLDTMLQMCVLRLPGRGLRLPTRVRSLRVDPSAHLERTKPGSCVAQVDTCMDMVVAGGVELHGLHATVTPRKQDSQTAVLESIDFVPYLDDAVKAVAISNVSKERYFEALGDGPLLKVMLGIVIENKTTPDLNICEVGAAEGKAFTHVQHLVSLHPLVQLRYTATDRDNLLGEFRESAEERGVEVSSWDVSKRPPAGVSKLVLVIASNLIHQTDDVSSAVTHLKSALAPQGFLLLHEVTASLDVAKAIFGRNGFSAGNQEEKYFLTEEQWCDVLKKEGFRLASLKRTGCASSLMLFRLAKEALEKEPIVVDIDESFDWVPRLQDLMAKGNAAPIWIHAATDSPSGIVGMTNCLRQEMGGGRIRCLFNASSAAQDALTERFEELRTLDLAMNVYKDGKFGSYRHVLMSANPSADEETEHAYVNVLTRGDLSSLRWIASHLKFAPNKEGTSELCSVFYTSLNFRDIMLATGKLPPDALPGDLANQDCILGMEFSGLNQAGKRIMGLLPAQALATTVMAEQRFTWEVPQHWSLKDAASVPVVYSTAYYALIVRGKLGKGESVLIHSGSGGVGQAAISICLPMGCDVYTTVGTAEKREYLLKTFPGLKPENIGNSRDLTFEQLIMHRTNGRGVNMVLNSLAEEKLQASIRCLARHGRFLEIGKYDLSNNTPLGMALFLRNVAFHGILLDAIFEENNPEWSEVSDLLTAGIKSGAVRPLKTTVFEREEIEDAFRFMAQGKHIGKVLVQVRPEDSTQSRVKLVAHARSMCDPNKSYVITGGLGGFGLELAHWLVDRGARNIVLTSRRGIRTGYQALRVKVWREMGVNVVSSTNDVSTEAGAKALVDEAKALGPLGGIFHLAVVLRDSLFVNQSIESFQQVASPKYHGTINLDRLTRQADVAKHLHWFVVFSSIFNGHGNAGQTNYGFANSAMERICERRAQDGLPGVAVQWGAIGDVGLIQDTLGGSNETVIGGTLPQRMSYCLLVLDRFLSQAHPVVSSYVLAAKIASKSDRGSAGDLVGAVAHILGVKDVETINPDTTLADLGVDSLMGVEVHQTLERDYEIELNMKEVRLLTVNKLRELATTGTNTTGKDPKADGESSKSPQHDGALVPVPRISSESLVSLNKARNHTDALFLIHNINGTVEPLRNLATNLSCPVYGLQYTADSPKTSVVDLAAFYIERMREVQPQGPYRVAGYSFGACVAIEMALQLEKTSELASLVLLDGSQAYVQAHTTWHRKRLIMKEGSWGPEAVAEVLSTLTPQYAKVDKTKLLEALQAETLVEKQVDITSEAIATASDGALTKDVVSAFLGAFMNLLRMGEQYRAAAKVRADVQLIRAKITDVMGKTLGEDFNLKQVCDGKISLTFVDGDHESFLQGSSAEEVANVITAASHVREKHITNIAQWQYSRVADFFKCT